MLKLGALTIKRKVKTLSEKNGKNLEKDREKEV